ncbi:MAG: stalk domain-containing protein [Methylocystaceae bacterium]
MHNYIRYILMTMLVLVCTAIGITVEPSAASAAGIGIVVDGQLVNCNPGAYITQDRTMVPLRFIMEAPGVNADISWDGAKQQVTVKHNGNTLVLTINSKIVYQDGQQVTTDVAPLIRQDRTFVPLRFLSESLGAVVSWSNLNNQALVNFKVRPEVWAYYYASGKDELRSHANKVTDVVFRWLQTDGNGDITYEYADDYQGVTSLAQELGYRRHLSVMLFDPDQLHQLLSVPANRAHFIDQMREVLQSTPAEGINLDLEMMRAEDREAYTALCRELKAAFPDKMVTAAVMAKTSDSQSWVKAFDYWAIGQVLDRVMIMAYDEHYSSGSPGAVASYKWVKQVVDYATSVVPANKLMLGLPAYGYTWVAGGSGRALDQNGLSRLAANGVTVSYQFNYDAYSPYMTYWENGKSYTAWLENYTSLNEKWNLALTNQLSGVFFWRMGGELEAINEVFPTRS